MILKRVIFAVAVAGLFLLGACHQPSGKSHGKINSQQVKTKAAVNAPVMTFTETVHNFGKLTQGEIVKYAFHFKNTGKSNLQIVGVRTSCGCTVGKYPRKPVKPGEEADIVVTFNSAYKMGFQDKSIMLLANTKPARTVLRIEANVVVPKNK